MAYQHKMQRNRFEYKYLIDERTAHEIRTFTRAYLVHDENAKPENRWAYDTHSVYLDGPGLPLYHQVVQGQTNRYKLRVRYYTEIESDPVYFEVKRRVKDAIMKDRALVKRDRALRLLEGASPRLSDLVKPGNLDHWSSLRKFCDMRDAINATGRTFVSYTREAWVKPNDDNVRLTFDRNLCGGRYDGTFVVKREVYPPPLLPGHPCVLELKWTDRFPFWFREMARCLNLERRNNAKYCQTAFWVPRAKSIEHGEGGPSLQELVMGGD